jgi:hypothetical protein
MKKVIVDKLFRMAWKETEFPETTSSAVVQMLTDLEVV